MILSRLRECLPFWVMAAFSLGCQGTENLIDAGAESSSQLHGVYDDQYFLRLAKSPDTEDVYRFEACLTSEGLVQEASCVGALTSDTGGDITFTTEFLDQLALTDEQKEQLNKSHGEWDSYREALRSKRRGDALAAGAAVLGSAAVGQVVVSQNLMWDGASGSFRSVAGVIAEERKKIAQFYDIKAQKAQLNEDWEKVFGTATPEEAKKQVDAMEAELKARGYSADHPPKSVLPKADQAKLNKLRSYRTSRYLMSDHFYSYLEDSFSVVLERHNKDIGNLIYIPENLEKFTTMNWRDTIDGFLAQGGTLEDVIDSKYVDYFLEYNKINHKFVSIGQSPNSFAELKQILMGTSEEIISLIDRTVSFVHFEGVPKHALWAWESFVKNKKIYLAGDGLGVAKSSDAVKKSVTESLGKIKKVRAAKPLAGSKFVGRAALVVGALTAGIIAFSRRGLQVAGSGVYAVQGRTDQLQQFFLDPSSLMSEDVHSPVTSVKDTLNTLSLWHQEFGVDTKASITSYCLPVKTAPDASIEAQCYKAL